MWGALTHSTNVDIHQVRTGPVFGRSFACFGGHRGKHGWVRRCVGLPSLRARLERALPPPPRLTSCAPPPSPPLYPPPPPSVLPQEVADDEKLQAMHDAAEKFDPRAEGVFKYLQVGAGVG